MYACYYYRDISTRVTFSINRGKGGLFSSAKSSRPRSIFLRSGFSWKIGAAPLASIRATSKRIKKLEKQCSRLRGGEGGKRKPMRSLGVPKGSRIGPYLRLFAPLHGLGVSLLFSTLLAVNLGALSFLRPSDLAIGRYSASRVYSDIHSH